jgi:hypothetical protein
MKVTMDGMEGGNQELYWWPVFRIRNVLVRIRIPDSYHWIRDLDPDLDSALFFSGFQDVHRKSYFFYVFMLITGTYFRYIYISLQKHVIYEVTEQ